MSRYPRSCGRALLQVGFLAGLSACGYDCEKGDGVADILWREPSELKRIVVTGEPVSQRLEISAVGGCVAKQDVRVSLQVWDPNGTEVPVEQEPSTEEDRSHALWARTSARFTPSVPGLYRMRAVFGPELKSSERTLLVARGASEALRPVRSLTDGRCYEVFHTARGAWLCDGKVYREGDAVGELPGVLAVQGDVVWQASEDTLTRYEDTDLGLIARASASLPKQEPVMLLRVGPDGAMVLTSKSLLRFKSTDRGLVPAGKLLVNFYTQSSFHGLWSGSTFFVAYWDTYSGGHVCAFTLTEPEGLSPSPHPCQSFKEFPLGDDEDSLWFGKPGLVTTQPSSSESGIVSLTRLVPDGEELKPAFQFGLPSAYEANASRTTGRPWISSTLYGQQYRVRVSDTRVWFEELSLPGQTIYAASGPWLVASAPHVAAAYLYGP